VLLIVARALPDQTFPLGIGEWHPLERVANWFDA
jgi:hypothetical protein